MLYPNTTVDLPKDRQCIIELLSTFLFDHTERKKDDMTQH